MCRDRSSSAVKRWLAPGQEMDLHSHSFFRLGYWWGCVVSQHLQAIILQVAGPHEHVTAWVAHLGMKLPVDSHWKDLAVVFTLLLWLLVLANTKWEGGVCLLLILLWWITSSWIVVMMLPLKSLYDTTVIPTVTFLYSCTLWCVLILWLMEWMWARVSCVCYWQGSFIKLILCHSNTSNKSLFSLTALIKSVMFINSLLWYFCTSSILHLPNVGVVISFFRSL